MVKVADGKKIHVESKNITREGKNKENFSQNQ